MAKIYLMNLKGAYSRKKMIKWKCTDITHTYRHTYTDIIKLSVNA